MATKLNTYDIGTNDLTNLIATLDAQRQEFESVSISNMDNTTAPVILQGSIWNVAGSVYYSSANETPSGSTATPGIYYIKGVVSGSTLTYTWTTTAPTWDPEKSGWYGTGGAADDRYLPYEIAVSGAVFLKKRLMTKELFDMISFSYSAVNLGVKQGALDVNIGASGPRLSWDGGGDDVLHFYNKQVSVEEDFEAVQDVDIGGDTIADGSIQFDFRPWENSTGNVFQMTPGNETQGQLFTVLDPKIPNVGDYMKINGHEAWNAAGSGIADWRWYEYAYREFASRIRLIGTYMRFNYAGGTFNAFNLSAQVNQGSGTPLIGSTATGNGYLTW